MNRDGVPFELRVFTKQNHPLDRDTWSRVTDLYISRLLSKYKKKAKHNPIYRKVFIWRYKYLKHDTKSLYELPNSMHALLMSGNDVMAFLSGYLSHDGKTLAVPRLAINSSFQTYSPGYILLTELQKYLESETVCRSIDLSRGAEKYKTDLGGTLYHTTAVTITQDHHQ